jgi:hypothetical protein
MRILAAMAALVRKTDPLLAINGPMIFSPSQQAGCQKIRSVLRIDDAKRMRDQLAFHLGSFLLQTGEEVNIGLAQILARTLADALGTYEKLDANKREWLRIAIEYFTMDNDATPDVKDSIGGLNDDANVVAAVLEHCGFHVHAKQIRDYLA